MDHKRPRRTQDEIRARRLVLVDDEGRARAVLEMVTSGDPRNGGLAETPRLSLLTETGRAALVLEVDARSKPRVRVGDADRGAVTEVEAGLVLLGLGGNSRAVLLAREDGGVLHLCDESGGPVVRLPEGDVGE